MYSYKTERSKLFTASGQERVMNCKDSITPILEKAGCIRMGEAMSYAGGGDTFSMLATVDRLIEMGYLREINFGECHGQDRIFVKGSK